MLVVSVELKRRPARSGIFIVRKYSGANPQCEDLDFALVRAAFDFHITTGVTAVQQCFRCVADAGHPGHRTDLALQIRIESGNLIVLISCKLRIDIKDEKVSRVEASIDPAQVGECAQEQPCARQHDHGKSHLKDDQSAAKAEQMGAHVVGCGRGIAFQVRSQVGL